MKPKWLNQTESVREKSDKRVKKFAKQTGGRVTSNSGATPFGKGDISYKDKLLEHKMTSKKSFKLDKDSLIKIYYEALKESKEPVFVVDFGDIKLIGQITKGEK